MRNVGTEWQQFGVGRHDMVGGDVVFQISGNFAGEGFRNRFTQWHALDVWPFNQWGVADLFIAREDEEVVVTVIAFRNLNAFQAGVAGRAG